MEIITKALSTIFTFYLVRRVVAEAQGVPSYRWAIIARHLYTNVTYVYRASHWRDTVGEDEPYRPWNELSFCAAWDIDPALSEGWVEVGPRTREQIERGTRHLFRLQKGTGGESLPWGQDPIHRARSEELDLVEWEHNEAIREATDPFYHSVRD